MKRKAAARGRSNAVDQRSGKVREGLPAPAIRFTAPLLMPRRTGKPVTWTFIILPKAASQKLPSRGQNTVEGTLNNVPLQATLEPDGKGGHWLKVERKLRIAAGAEVGDVVPLEVTPVAEEPEPKVPADLRKAIAAAPRAREVWADITPMARRDWIQWVTSGKRAETRTIRIEKTCDMLANGKRRPCCFDRSGMYDKGLSCPEAEPATPIPPRHRS